MGGGVLYEIGVHHFDLVEWLLGDPLREVWATGQSRSTEFSSAVVSGTTVKGTLWTSAFSQESVPRNRFEICGSAGRVDLDLYRSDGLRVYERRASVGGVSSRLNEWLSNLVDLPRGIGVGLRGGDYQLSYRRQWECILAALRSDRRAVCTERDGLRAVQVVAAVMQSAGSGAPVAVPLDRSNSSDGVDS